LRHPCPAERGQHDAAPQCDRYRFEADGLAAAALLALLSTRGPDSAQADPALGWWAENSKCCYQEAFRNLDRALADFVKSRRGQRKGKKLGFPWYKKRRKRKDSFRLTGTIRCDGNTVTLPRLGVITTHEPTTKLARRRWRTSRLPEGNIGPGLRNSIQAQAERSGA
jgi:transposase